VGLLLGGCKESPEEGSLKKSEKSFEGGSMTSREVLIKKIKQQAEAASITFKESTPEEFMALANVAPSPRPIVSLEDFFEGNNDLGSIGCNLIEHPGIETFYKVLKDIRERDDVQDVIIEISQIEETDETMWPFSETVYILTSADIGKVKEWMKPLKADEFFEGWFGGKASAAPELQAGIKVYGAWWD